jgi:hypothetical protein
MTLVPDGVAVVDQYLIRRHVHAGQHRFLRIRRHVDDNVIAYHHRTAA